MLQETIMPSTFQLTSSMMGHHLIMAFPCISGWISSFRFPELVGVVLWSGLPDPQISPPLIFYL